ncbi:VanW family protein [Actinomadura rudentiformis]|uniref:VanW family protein n=1 Tax=Actinomadura rudentiformis TaxID=359158 RepID=UPI00178C28D3|nr:VanW family protein [Actinomadura rudentiformis]
MGEARRTGPARHGRHRGAEDPPRVHGDQPGLAECALRWWPFVAGALAVTAILLGTYLVAGIGLVAGLGPRSPNASAAERPVRPATTPPASAARSASDTPPPGIHRLISTYTTRFKAGEPRVRNIQIGARRLDGTLVRPGAVFSFNRVVGPRTRGRGYVPAPAIVGSRMVDDVGGGICQVSATLFNAVFQGGLKIRKWRPHSMWMPDYPQGREAAVAYPGLDFTWRNDTGRPVLIRASYTHASLTVSLWGTRRYEVRTRRSQPYAFVPFTSAVVRGPRCIPMTGGRGFQIDVWRTLKSDGRQVRREKFHTTYGPQARVRCA